MKFNGMDGYLYGEHAANHTVVKFTGITVSANNGVFRTLGGVYPNPAQNKLYFDLPRMGSTSIKVYDYKGGLVEQKTIDGPYVNISIYQPGVYFLVLEVDGSTNSYKFIKE
ncbi:MAG: T9SS type A sorting domain-containing protein [Flavobacteriales bacterium]|nr:T9SS type A sorting domain-containing protein [Flavobacteriales bacterium]